jgi:hypothetical protein
MQAALSMTLSFPGQADAAPSVAPPFVVPPLPLLALEQAAKAPAHTARQAIIRDDFLFAPCIGFSFCPLFCGTILERSRSGTIRLRWFPCSINGRHVRRPSRERVARFVRVGNANVVALGASGAT